MSYLDKNGVSRLWTHIVSRLGDKVDKEDGKTLSSNDYTDADKARLDSFKSVGNETRGIYFNANGEPVAVGCSVKTNVPTGAQFTDTTYTAGDGLALSADNEFSHSNAVVEKTNFASTSTTASANGGSITVTDVKYDAQGHITGSQDRTITLSQEVPTLDSIGAAAKEHSHGLVKNDGTLNVSEGNKIMAVDANKKITTWSAETTRNALGLDDRYLGKDVVASSTLGSVKTTSDVTDITDYLAVPIVDGVPYFKKQVQADWNENDSSSDAYVKNRIGGYTKNTTITLTGTMDAESNQAKLDSNDFGAYLVPGRTYKISFKNVDYETKAWRMSANDILFLEDVDYDIDSSGITLYIGLGEDPLVDSSHDESSIQDASSSVIVPDSTIPFTLIQLTQSDLYRLEGGISNMKLNALLEKWAFIPDDTKINLSDGEELTITIQGDFDFPIISKSTNTENRYRIIDNMAKDYTNVVGYSLRNEIESTQDTINWKSLFSMGKDDLEIGSKYSGFKIKTTFQPNSNSDLEGDIDGIPLDFRDESKFLGWQLIPKPNSVVSMQLTGDNNTYTSTWKLVYKYEDPTSAAGYSWGTDALGAAVRIVDFAFCCGKISILTGNTKDDPAVSDSGSSPHFVIKWRGNYCVQEAPKQTSTGSPIAMEIIPDDTLELTIHSTSLLPFTMESYFYTGITSTIEAPIIFDRFAYQYINGCLTGYLPITGGTLMGPLSSADTIEAFNFTGNGLSIDGPVSINSTDGKVILPDLTSSKFNITDTYYPSFTITPTAATSTLNKAVIEGSYDGKLALGAWDDSDGKNRRILEVYSKNGKSSLDDALLLRTCENDTWSSYRVFHSGTTVPLTAGGTGATTAAGALMNLGAFPTSGGTFTGAVMACADAQKTLSTSQLRNITISTTDLVEGESTLAEGEIYLVYDGGEA